MSAFVHFFTNSYIKRVRYPANAHTHLTTQFCHPTTSLPTLISCPWSGLNPTGASQVRTIGTIPFRSQCWPRQARCHHGARLAHAVPIWGHHRAGARPRPSRCPALATSTEAGYPSYTIINGRSLRRVGYHTQSNINGRWIRMVGYHTYFIYCNRIVIYLNKNRVILSTRLTFLVTYLASYFSFWGKV